MARRSSRISPIFAVLLLIILVFAGYIFFFTDFISFNKQVDESKVKPIDTSVFEEAESWVPEVVWSKPKAGSEKMYYGTAKGVKIVGTLVNREGTVDHFEDPKILKRLGYKEDLNLSADGPGSSMWGYSKENANGMMEIVTFSYDNKDMYESSDGPLVSECPCTLILTVFVSEPFKPNWK